MTTQMRVLIVDDEKLNRELMIHLLKPIYKIMVAKNGEQALKAATSVENTPDLILLDIMMPDMDGYEVCRRLKADAATRDIPVIFVTAKGDVDDECRGLDLGAVDYISKPVSLRILQARVETHLKQRQMQVTVEKQKNALQEVAQLRDDVEHVIRHDLKAPLNTIIPLSTLLARREKCNDEDKQLLKRIEQAGYKMLNMINNSLDLYKMEMGTYPLKTEAVNLLPLLQTVLSEVSDAYAVTDSVSILRFQGKEVTETDELYAEAESMLCYPLFYNLILNAFEALPEVLPELSPEVAEEKFSNPDMVEIDLEVEGSYVSVKITNHGAVPESIRDSFFDKFITQGKPGGTGLGTYTARLCAETQHGTISMNSLLEERTEVIVRLPRVEQ